MRFTATLWSVLSNVRQTTQYSLTHTSIQPRSDYNNTNTCVYASYRHSSSVSNPSINNMVSSTATQTPREWRRSGSICVEGNIGCGKTTLLDYFRNYMQQRDKGDASVTQSAPSVIAEPVERWRNVEGENLFHYLYKDPTRYSLAFQTYVQLTMTKLHAKRPQLMERSIYSARYCFVENLYNLKHLSRLEYVILDKWFKHLVLTGEDSMILDQASDLAVKALRQLEYEFLSQPRGVDIDLIVYLRCPPQKVMDRIKVRSREEERDIPFEYIQNLHDLHEDWLIMRKFPVPAPVLVLNTDCDQASLSRLYEKAAPYISGEKPLQGHPMIISVEGDESNFATMKL